MKYVQYVNELIGKKTSETKNLVLFGQNIAAGSHLTGLTKGLQVGEGGLIINSCNSEYTLTGMGFGLMMSGVPSIFFTKQQDFLLLGIEQLVDTYNFIRRKVPTASFTIVMIALDLGYHGPQSSMNNLGDFASIARVPGFAVTNKVDTEEVVDKYLVSPGFRIIGLSQRLFAQELLEPEKLYSNDEKTLFQYARGDKATIVCFNFSFPEGFELYKKLSERGASSSLFSVSAVIPIDWGRILEDVKNTKQLIILENSKSENLSCYQLMERVRKECGDADVTLFKRELSEDFVIPQHDQLEVNYEDIVNKLAK